MEIKSTDWNLNSGLGLLPVRRHAPCARRWNEGSQLRRSLTKIGIAGLWPGQFAQLQFARLRKWNRSRQQFHSSIDVKYRRSNNMGYGPANIVFNDFHQIILKYRSKRIPGTAYTFKYFTRDNYCCVSCFELRKIRSITVRNRRIVVRKNPEDWHHFVYQFQWKHEWIGWFTII